MPGSSLELSSALEQRILAAASVLRLSPDAFLERVMAQFYNTIGGLPRDLLRCILTYLDYTTISAVLVRVCRLWHDCVLEDPQHLFSRLRQMHGIHLLDPAHGLFYFPRALKRVVMESKAGGGAGSPPPVSLPGSNPSPAGSAAARRGHIPVVNSQTNAVTPSVQPRFSDPSAAHVVPASSFLTVDIRTQNTKSLPWGYVRETVQSAIAGERVLFGEVRTPALQRTEGPVWSQAATVAFNRRLYMFGGETYEGVVMNRAYEYDPMTKHWGVLPSLNEKRAAAAAVTYGGLIFVFGGYNDEGNVLDTYEVLEVESRTWISQIHAPQWLYGEQFGAPSAASPTGTHGSCRRASSSSWASQDATASWPFTTVLPPRWMGVGRRSAVAGLYRMPEKVCGTAATLHGEVVLLVGGHKSCIEPEETAVSYSAMNSAAATPMHATTVGNGAGTAAAAGDLASSTASTSPTHTPQRLPRVGSISVVGPATAESFVWVFCPRTGRWWTQGPRLPSPRAFGAAAVLELPILGPCLCYFGGCAKADTPETAMFYIPLCAPTDTRDVASMSEGGPMASARAAAAAAAATSPGVPRCPGSASSLPSPDGAHSTATPTARTPPPPQQQQQRCATPEAAVHPEGGPNLHDSDNCNAAVDDTRGGASGADHAGGGSADVAGAVLARVFRDTEELPWQRYVRIPIGGAFTSVVVIGAEHSRTLVLTGFYPAPNIGFCKVNHLLPLDAFIPLLGALSAPPTARRYPAARRSVSPVAADPTTAAPVSGGSSTSPPPLATITTSTTTTAFVFPPTLQLDLSLRDEAAVAVQHWQQEREWSQDQWRETRDMVRAAAHAATMRHPRNPQTAGEEHKWSLAPVPEVRVVNRSEPPLLRVSWKVQTLNAKVIVGIE